MKWIILAALAAAAYWFFKNRVEDQGAKTARSTKTKAKKTEQEDTGNEFHGVSIAFAEGQACAAARDLQGKRFLSAEAPLVPLPGCDAEDCRCRYQHHDDRRNPDGDRRMTQSLERNISNSGGQEERRESMGRRLDDYDIDFED